MPMFATPIFSMIFALIHRGGDLLYSLPIIVAVSLVYAATRHERMRPILVHACRVFLWIVGFMVAVFLFMAFLDWMA